MSLNDRSHGPLASLPLGGSLPPHRAGGHVHTFLGPANIREHVSVDAGANRFHGRFSIDQYNADGSVVLVHLDGINQRRASP